jgi:hypothetical protein
VGPDDPRAPTQEFMLRLSYKWAFVDVFGSRWVRRLLQSVVLLAFNACHSDNAAGLRVRTKCAENVNTLPKVSCVFLFFDIALMRPLQGLELLAIETIQV